MSKLKVIVQGRPVWLLIAAVLAALLAGLMIPTAAPIRGPLVDINDGLLIAVLGGLGLFVGHLYTRLSKLEDRITAMEAAKDAALDKLTAAASFINRIGLYIAGGMRGPLPEPPEQILPHIDAGFWEQDSPGGTD